MVTAWNNQPSGPEYGSYLKVELIEVEKFGEKEFLVRFSLNGEILPSQLESADVNTGKKTGLTPLTNIVAMLHAESP